MNLLAIAAALIMSVVPEVAWAGASWPVEPPRTSPSRPPRTIEITATDDMTFSVTRIVARPGERVRIVLESVGTMPKTMMAHNWILLHQGTDEEAFVNAGVLAAQTNFVAPAYQEQVLAATGLVGPGETTEVTFTAPTSVGVYPFVCSFRGHWMAGMGGTLTVK